MKSIFFFSILLFVSCNAATDEDLLPESLPFALLMEPTKRIEVLQKLESKNQEFFKARKIARKKFDSVLTKDEKAVISKIRKEYFKDRDKEAALVKKHIEQLDLDNSLKKLVLQQADLEFNKLKNMKMGIEEMLIITRGEHSQKINDLSLKYYHQIIKIESEYSPQMKDFYQKKLKELEEGEEKTLIWKIDGVDYYIGKTDYCMRFLLVNPE